MGCDIHMFAENKEDKKWVMLEDAFRQENYDKKKYWCPHPYDDRNYELFAFLANIRNANNIQPICKPKGCPPNASHGFLHQLDVWDCDAHSISWFTLKELKEIPKKLLEQTIYDSSLILEKDEEGNITGTCRDTNGKHFGEVGERKLFKLFKTTGSPIEFIIKQLKSTGFEDDENIRIVFFFDN